jgi:hypothetical protein
VWETAMGFPFFEVLSYETELPVCVSVWHVRSVRPIREHVHDDETITRIEFANGDVIDTSATVEHVLDQMSDALYPVTEYLFSVRKFMNERTD